MLKLLDRYEDEDEDDEEDEEEIVESSTSFSKSRPKPPKRAKRVTKKKVSLFTTKSSCHAYLSTFPYLELGYFTDPHGYVNTLVNTVQY